MALTINTKIVNDADNYSLDAKQVKGGYGVVDTQAALASLPVATIVEGSLYYVQESDKYYLYNGTSWQEAKFGGVWGDITGTISNQTDLVAEFNKKQDNLPTVTKDRYLHTNSTTGNLEWSEVVAGVSDVTANGTSVVEDHVAALTFKNVNGTNTYGSGDINIPTAAVSTTEPTDPNVNIWVNPEGELGTFPWSNISQKPETFPPSVHTHDDRYYTESEIDTKLQEKQNTITTSNKLNADLISNGSTNKVVTQTEKDAWEAKQPAGNYMTLDTDQTANSKKTLSYTESIEIGGQETILNVLSTHTSDDMSAMWAGRVKIGNRDKTFLLGVYRQAQLGQSAICGIGAHSWNDSFEESGAAWEDIYLNPDGNKAVYIGDKDWRNDTGWFKVQNDGGESAKYRTYINRSTIQNPIWSPVLGNLNSTSSSIFLSPTITNNSSQAYCTSLGAGATPSSSGITNVGYNTTSSGQYGTALGYNAHANAQNAIQIGTGTNSSTKTLSVGLDSTHNYQLLNSSGLIPNERLQVIDDSATSGTNVTWSVNKLASKQDKIDSSNKLLSDLVDDTNQNNKFVTSDQKTHWDTVYSKVPSQTYAEGNELADKTFVNSSIATQTANFLGTLDAVADLGLNYGATTIEVVTALNAYEWLATLTNNDYCYVINKETQGGELRFVYQRYKYRDVEPKTFLYEYSLNNSSFTAAQWAAINSGITSSLVSDIIANTAARHSHGNKALLDTYSQTEANLADAVSKKHSHENKAVLDGISASDISNWNAKGIIKVFTNVSADTWEYDETYSDFQYSCIISISGITSSMTAQVVFPLDLAMTGYYAPICETGEGYIKIFSMTDSSITLNSITVWSE